ncbi:GntR family transcriptional regulator [Pseudonocardia sp. GCM10023141]|uniref:GntR family transcriptional regulator n=1 Tax=Pseudonocardia sp. GCM10023141 TaxID=3252653 RepID=UPI0036213F35
MSDQVTDTVRRMILMGDLHPGDQITQDALAGELGVSTMPIREALLQLSHEGLITGGRGRSFRVARTTRRDIADVYWLHATLAGELTARACEQLDDEQLALLAEVHSEWKEAVRTHDVAGLETTNFEFHRIINQAAGAPTMLRLMRNTLRRIPERFYMMLPDWADTSTTSHEAILQALQARDPERARTEAANHVQESGKMLIEFFDEKGFWTAPETGS